jgi:hypothetical protein
LHAAFMSTASHALLNPVIIFFLYLTCSLSTNLAAIEPQIVGIFKEI